MTGKRCLSSPLFLAWLATTTGCGLATTSNAECERALFEEWQTEPPAVGLALPAASATFDEPLRDLMRTYNLPGGTVAVLREGQLVFAKAYGFADRDAPQPAHVDSRFRIASLSKPLTATAALVLEQNGQLSLDEHPFVILNDLKPPPGKTKTPGLDDITLRQLLNMSGGWSQETSDEPFANPAGVAQLLGTPGPATSIDTVRWVLAQRLPDAPGTTYCYSNLGYEVVGETLARKAGMPYEHLVRRQVLEPLGMLDTFPGGSLLSERGEEEVLYYDSPNTAAAVPSVFPWPPQLVPAPYGGFSLEQYQASGAWVSTTVDLLRLVRSLDSPPGLNILTSQSIQSMMTDPKLKRNCSPEDTTGYFGLGWQFNDVVDGVPQCWSKGGNLPGTATNITRTTYSSSPIENCKRYAFVALFNSALGESQSDDLSNQLFKVLYAVTKQDAWSQRDLFDQYTAFGPWQSARDFTSDLAYQRRQGRYPSRIEGRIGASGMEYRAEFVPLPLHSRARQLVGADCNTYRETDTRNRAQGYIPVDLQLVRDESGAYAFQASWLRWGQ